MSRPTDEEMCLQLAEVVGRDVSEAMLVQMQARAPRLAALVHALALAWAAKVAEASLRHAVQGSPDALQRYLTLKERAIERAETHVALTLSQSGKGGS